jgi:hypothetical protein
MIDPTDVTAGDDVQTSVITPFQTAERPEPYDYDLRVGAVDSPGYDDDGRPREDSDDERVIIYFAGVTGGDGKFCRYDDDDETDPTERPTEEADGYARRAVFSDPEDTDPTYERPRGAIFGEETIWTRYSVENGFDIRPIDDDSGASAVRKRVNAGEREPADN